MTAIYIASPYTHGNQDENVRKSPQEAENLRLPGESTGADAEVSQYPCVFQHKRCRMVQRELENQYQREDKCETCEKAKFAVREWYK